MKIKLLHPNVKAPTRATDGSGAYDLYMPDHGLLWNDNDAAEHGLGFAMEVPTGHVALILPRSGVGFIYGLELNNTCGVIDSDYRGELRASLRLKNDGDEHAELAWDAGDRLLQMLIVPVATPEIEVVDELSDTERGAGGLGSTGV